MIKVFFFRGLNTYGDDSIRVGPIRLGPYHKNFEGQVSHKVQIILVSGMGAGTIEEMSAKAREFILSQHLSKTKEPFHFLGHSMGGLIARRMAHYSDVCENLKTICTIGTPHFGNDEVIERIIESQDRLHNKLKYFGYNVKQRQKYFLEFHTNRLNLFNEKYSDRNPVSYASIIGKKHPSKLSAPMKLLYRTLGKPAFPSDGLVPEASQGWGKTICQVELDHMEQLGLCATTSPKIKKAFKIEFKKMLDSLNLFWGAS